MTMDPKSNFESYFVTVYNVYYRGGGGEIESLNP